MEWEYFVIVIGACILVVCKGESGTSKIIDMMLVEGEKPNEGRIEFLRSDSIMWEPICEHGLEHDEASVICRQLGYPGVNNIIPHWPLEASVDLAEYRLDCIGDEENLANCSLIHLPYCFGDAAGVVCYERGYIGCYRFPSAVFQEVQTKCECGLKDSEDLTALNCITFCNRRNENFAGLFRGATCLCGSGTSSISQLQRVADALCSYACTGRNIERCGGSSYVALFNIGMVGLGTTDSGANNPIPSTGELVTTNSSSTFSAESINLSGNCTCIQQAPSWATEGVQIFLIAFVIALALYGVAISLFHALFRRSNVSSSTEEIGPDPYMELQLRSEVDKTYQEIVAPTDSSKSPEERSQPPADLIYVNQPVVQYEKKIRDGGNVYT